MIESTTYQGIIEEGMAKGRAEEARKILLQQGRKRFGEAGKSVSRKLNDIADLERMSLRLLDVVSWRELLETP